jgi:hypothetical protein
MAIGLKRQIYGKLMEEDTRYWILDTGFVRRKISPKTILSLKNTQKSNISP